MYEIIAMVTMLIDHVGFVFFPDEIWLRVIGRIAMPIYTYGIVQGLKHTSNFKKYVFRLLILAIISQPFYKLYFEIEGPNMIFTLLACLLLLKYHEKETDMIKYFIIVAAAFFTQMYHFDYGMYAVFLAFIYYYQKYTVCCHAVLEAVYILLRLSQIQVFSIVSSIFMVNVKNIRLQGKTRYFYRIFYPLHLAVLLLIKIYLGV